VKKEFDEAKLRFAAAEVCEPTCRICIVYIYIYITAAAFVLFCCCMCGFALMTSNQQADTGDRCRRACGAMVEAAGCGASPQARSLGAACRALCARL
jgi:hypothetical protein